MVILLKKFAELLIATHFAILSRHPRLRYDVSARLPEGPWSLQ